MCSHVYLVPLSFTGCMQRWSSSVITHSRVRTAFTVQIGTGRSFDTSNSSTQSTRTDRQTGGQTSSSHRPALSAVNVNDNDNGNCLVAISWLCQLIINIHMSLHRSIAMDMLQNSMSCSNDESRVINMLQFCGCEKKRSHNSDKSKVPIHALGIHDLHAIPARVPRLPCTLIYLFSNVLQPILQLTTFYKNVILIGFSNRSTISFITNKNVFDRSACYHLFYR